MANRLKRQINSKLFRKIFTATFIATILPVITMIFLWVKNGYLPNDVGTIWIYTKFFGIILFAFLVASFVAYYISQYITAPISEITKSATKIAQGNFSHKIQIESDDEIGRLARLFNYMTTELRRLNKMNLAKIIAERNKTQTIIKNIADGVIVTDTHGRIMLLNASTERWFGLDENDGLEKPLSNIIREKKLLDLISEATTKKDTALPAVEISYKIKGDWKQRTFQARAARVQQENGELFGIVMILRDITQQKEIDKMKNELVSMVAHELRSPLTSISGFSELLLDSDITKRQSNEYANIILNESKRLSDLINKFLDISRIESGRIQPKKIPLDMEEVIQMVVGNNSYLAAKKHIDVEIHGISKLGKISADPGMMEQVFLNLFSNAVKYSPENTRIDFVLKNSGTEIIVQVHDHGYGIPEDALPNIFEKFYRVSENENVRDVIGSGLGLSLVKQIVDMHGGHVEVESKVGHGSVFSVYLPRITHKPRLLLDEESDDIIH
ncbi:HAMP domain-containing protein [candidate division KSB1 bacterium]|nr:HAMP domain-containing protein [candidate division KSB1 bacterium]